LEIIGLRCAGFGRPLEKEYANAGETQRRSQKGRPMWIYDGEQWIEEGANENETKRDRITPQHEEMYMPELQVVEVEIVPVPKPNYVPFPLP
jgi:hypothetical protein